MVGEHRDYLSNVISTFVAERLVRKGYDAYLALISDSAPAVTDIRAVRDFSDVFLEELSRVAPTREVEFGIDLLPGTA